MAHRQGFYEKYIKRPQDFVLATAATVVLSPVMLATGLLVKKKLGTPVIFSQERPGLNGKIFKLHKFRSMTDEKDEQGNLLPDDVRLTAFGKKLRSTSLDELPELFNIIKGDMAVVGPRPLLVRYLDRYNAHQARRHEVRPGFTGLAQVHGRNAITWEEKFDWDVKYVDHVSFLADWKIIFDTVKTVLKHEGISSGTTATMEEFMGTKEEERNKKLNVLFLTLVQFNSLQERNLYTDLLREFTNHGHHVYAISPTERRQKKSTHLIEEENATILRLQIGNTQKTNIIEKGISTVLIEPEYKRAIKEYFTDVKFDLVLYPTPPITLAGAVDYVRRRDNAKTYLMLKDIFPQNAVDIGMMSTAGPKAFLYHYFRHKEKKLYAISDRIGCMSPANVDYVIKHNPEVDPQKVEVCPNSMEVIDMSVSEEEKQKIRIKYGIPLDKKVFVYGGNLGKPQGISFVIECLKACKDTENAFFLIIGNGTEFGLLERYVNESRQSNLKLMKALPKEEFDNMVGACDVGLIFLDHRFTIPNFPSRLLNYLAAKLPVLACTDSNTDIGKTIVEGGFGWWCESDDAEKFASYIRNISKMKLSEIGEKGYNYLRSNYDTEEAVKLILEKSKW